jgi:hypothetical protein
VKKPSQNGMIGNGNGNTVITKESLILVPDNTITTNVVFSKELEQQQPQIVEDNNNEVCFFLSAQLYHTFFIFIG